MSRTCAWLVHASALAVGATGLVYGWMRYALEPVDEFALVNHPREPLLEDLHILAAPLLLFGCAAIWRTHVWARWRSGFRARRRTGLALALLLPPMALSGYVLQTRFAADARLAWIWVHATSSALWVATYVVHQVLPAGREP